MPIRHPVFTWQAVISSGTQLLSTLASKAKPNAFNVAEKFGCRFQSRSGSADWRISLGQPRLLVFRYGSTTEILERLLLLLCGGYVR